MTATTTATRTPRPPYAGLYALKSRYAQLLAPVRRRLVARHVAPAHLTVAGVAAAACAGTALAALPPGTTSALAVGGLLAARLAFANLDGGVAREGGTASRWGAVQNEVGDRAADLLALAGCLALAPSGWVALAALGATLPSWVALAGAVAGAPRANGGPVGKTERCALLVAIAAGAPAVPVLAVVAAGGVATAALRLTGIRRALVTGGAA